MAGGEGRHAVRHARYADAGEDMNVALVGTRDGHINTARAHCVIPRHAAFALPERQYHTRVREGGDAV